MYCIWYVYIHITINVLYSVIDLNVNLNIICNLQWSHGGTRTQVSTPSIKMTVSTVALTSNVLWGGGVNSRIAAMWLFSPRCKYTLFIKSAAVEETICFIHDHFKNISGVFPRRSCSRLKSPLYSLLNWKGRKNIEANTIMICVNPF